jgi:hypothetical protein
MQKGIPSAILHFQSNHMMLIVVVVVVLLLDRPMYLQWGHIPYSPASIYLYIYDDDDRMSNVAFNPAGTIILCQVV